ncbi:hypothetical protein L3V83_00740 [Thiotrichales bacterium 19X7-9]|nr:hypothetical protein [Thiotrichales bacterium 19X7-9]
MKQTNHHLNNLDTMHQNKGNNLVNLFRVCTKEEAENTFYSKLAGGEFKLLEHYTANDVDAISQIANNECFYNPAATNRNLANKKRTLVEYSNVPLTQFKGNCILISVNQSFIKKGSNIYNENGYLLQVGTPLNSVEIFDSPKQAMQDLDLKKHSVALTGNNSIDSNNYFFYQLEHIASPPNEPSNRFR